MIHLSLKKNVAMIPRFSQEWKLILNSLREAQVFKCNLFYKPMSSNRAKLTFLSVELGTYMDLDLSQTQAQYWNKLTKDGNILITVMK